MEPLSYRHWILFEGRRSTSANRAALSACTLGTFSHTSCFRIDCTLAGLSLRQLSTPSKLYRRQEHFRVLAKLSGQRQPIALRFQLALLGRFRIRAVSESTAPLRVCLFDSSAAVNVSQSRCAFSLRSWDVFAYGLLPNRLSPLGQASKSSPRHISTGRLHALRRFHSPPINLIVFEAPYRITP